MTPKQLETLVWVLIYGGLLTLSLGVFVQKLHDPIGWTLTIVGAVAAVAGAVLVWVRSRMGR
ncbi:hypothetical protein ACPOLB_03190 [Rubrivivax sp. RP6-9]|uniref:hypothetical protein n=1 Tax=Rubrivivax sp. RP6-9 TaxID=3415750 RepID=UPI003CC62753